MKRIFIIAIALLCSSAAAAPAPKPRPRAQAKPVTIGLIFDGARGAVVVRSEIKTTYVYINGDGWQETLRQSFEEHKPRARVPVEIRVKVDSELPAVVCQRALGVCSELGWARVK